MGNPQKPAKAHWESSSLVQTSAMVEGRHFQTTATPAASEWKSMWSREEGWGSKVTTAPPLLQASEAEAGARWGQEKVK